MPPRLLCLPGYLQNGRIFAEKSSGLRKLLTKKHGYELDYLDPPIIIEEKAHLPFCLAADEAEAETKWKGIKELGVNRCWWQHKEPGVYEGFDRSLEFVTNYIQEHGPYDGIIGFSQGAAMAAIVTNTLHLGLVVVKALGNPQPEFSVAVLISGFVFVEPKDPARQKEDINNDITDAAQYRDAVRIVPDFARYFADASNLSTQIVGVYGSEDGTVPPVRSKHLLSLYKNVREFEHDGGHYVPNKKQFLLPIVEVITGTKMNL